jgi:hypothetical protein
MRTFCLRIFYTVWACLLLVSCNGHNDTPLAAFNTVLTGREVIPAIASNAFGTGIVTVNLDTRIMIASVVTTGIAETEVHIHVAPFGAVGTTQFALARTPGTTLWTASAVLDDAQWGALRSGNFYMDVHSAAFPSGEIRGQLINVFPSSDQIFRVQQAGQLSSLAEQQLQQLRDIEDSFDGRFTGVGLTIGF